MKNIIAFAVTFMLASALFAENGVLAAEANDSVCFCVNVGAYYALGAETCEYTASTSAGTRADREAHALRFPVAITPTLGLC